MLARLLPRHNDDSDGELHDRRREMGALVLSSRIGVVVIAGYAAGRFEDLERRRGREGAQMMIDGDNETWRRTAPDVMALNEWLAHAAVELAWAEAEPPVGEGLELDAVATRVRELLDVSVPDDVLEAVEIAAHERKLHASSSRPERGTGAIREHLRD